MKKVFISDQIKIHTKYEQISIVGKPVSDDWFGDEGL